MIKRYYFDTSIWLDFFEDRNEPHLPKSEYAQQLVNKIIKENHKIIYSDFVLVEMQLIGYNEFELETMFSKLKPILLFVESLTATFQ